MKFGEKLNPQKQSETIRGKNKEGKQNGWWKEEDEGLI